MDEQRTIESMTDYFQTVEERTDRCIRRLRNTPKYGEAFSMLSFPLIGCDALGCLVESVTDARIEIQALETVARQIHALKRDVIREEQEREDVEG